MVVRFMFFAKLELILVVWCFFSHTPYGVIKWSSGGNGGLIPCLTQIYWLDLCFYDLYNGEEASDKVWSIHLMGLLKDPLGVTQGGLILRWTRLWWLDLCFICFSYHLQPFHAF